MDSLLAPCASLVLRSPVEKVRRSIQCLFSSRQTLALSRVTGLSPRPCRVQVRLPGISRSLILRRLFRNLSVGRVPSEGGCSSEKSVGKERGRGDTDGGCGRLMREGEALRRATQIHLLRSRPNPAEASKQPLERAGLPRSRRRAPCARRAFRGCGPAKPLLCRPHWSADALPIPC